MSTLTEKYFEVDKSDPLADQSWTNAQPQQTLERAWQYLLTPTEGISSMKDGQLHTDSRWDYISQHDMDLIKFDLGKKAKAEVHDPKTFRIGRAQQSIQTQEGRQGDGAPASCRGLKFSVSIFAISTSDLKGVLSNSSACTLSSARLPR